MIRKLALTEARTPRKTISSRTGGETQKCILLVAALIIASFATDAFSQTKKETEAALIGYWISSEATVEFKPKGVVVISGERYQWSVLGRSLVLTSNEGSLDMPFQLKGDILTVWFDGRKVMYEKTDKDGYDEALAMRIKGTGNSGGGGNPQDLVGKWCYSANVNASGGGRQSDLCFTLNSNGTYEYSGATSNSNIYGGSNSSSRDSGRWSATSNSLTARSNSGTTTTYTLERRNHPKTGDPMLMVDGDAFVTHYQKRPW